MQNVKGLLVLMGSGELTGTMVEVHKALLRRYGRDARAVFIDTPAGFQLNVDQIAEKAQRYFNTRVLHRLELVSCKSAQACLGADGAQALQTLSQADYILIGPGSPTYALNQWRQGPIPDLMTRRIEAGACLVAASAAALTIGRSTLPVYEIYKVGQELHWADGLDILNHFGFNLVVVPHWNNAEGGNHDTRFCFMGEPRFRRLEAMLPDETGILGLDEHTALMIDFARQEAAIEGIGRVTLRLRGREQVFSKGDRLPLDLLRCGLAAGHPQPEPPQPTPREAAPAPSEQEAVWRRLREQEQGFLTALDAGEPRNAAAVLLEVERLIWRNQDLFQESDSLGAAREVLRELLVLLAARMAAGASLAPLVDALLGIRTELRERKQWQAADAIRDSLKTAGIVVEDSDKGSTWHFENR